MLILPQYVQKIEMQAKRKKPLRAQMGLVKSFIKNINKHGAKLPATMTEVWALGNAMRCDETDGVDLIAVYHMDVVQKSKWVWLQGLIGDIGCVPDESRDYFESLRKPFRAALEQHYGKCLFAQALRTAEVSFLAREINLHTNWASCFTWTQYFSRRRGNGSFIPYENKVLQRLLVGRLAQRGLRVQFQNWPLTPVQLKSEYALDCRKIWVPGVSATQAIALMATSSKDKEMALKKRLAQITNDIEQKLREFNPMSTEIAKEAVKNNIALDTGQFFASILQFTSDTSAEGLEGKYRQLEQAQELLEKYEDMMYCIKAVLEGNRDASSESLMREIMAMWGKNEASEADARMILRLIGMPEQEYIIYRRRRFMRSRDVMHLTDVNTRHVINEQVSLLKEAHKLELKIRKILSDKNRMTADVHLSATRKLHIDEEHESVDIFGTAGKCVLSCYCPAKCAQEIQDKLAASQWHRCGGDNEDWSYITSFPVDLEDPWDTTKKAAYRAFEPFGHGRLTAETSFYSTQNGSQ